MSEDKIDIKKEYSKVKGLPKYDVLNNDFEIESLKDKEFLTRQIRRKMNEKIIFFCRIIESLLYPTQQHIINMREVSNFSEDKKKEIENVYKELMFLERQSLMLDVNPNEKDDIKYINEIFNFWKKIKPKMEKIVKLMQEAWKKEKSLKKNEYFG